MNTATFSEAVLAINRLACAVALPDFQAAALDALQQYIAFDSAWWGVASHRPDGSIGMHTSLTYRLPEEYAVLWNDLQRHDRMTQALSAAPGQAISLSAEAMSAGSDVAAGYLQRFHVAQCLSVMLTMPNLNQFSFLSLHRARESAAFAKSARELLQALMPHLEAARSTNSILHMERIRSQLPPAQAALALVDTRGRIHVVDSKLAELLRGEWPNWQGPDMPAELLQSLSSGTEFRGRRLVVHSAPVGGFRLLDVRQLSSAHRLTPRETEIARRFSAGASHKEVARELNIAPNTARHHLREIYRKLEITDKAELAAKLADSAEMQPLDAIARPRYDLAGSLRGKQ